MSENIPSPGTLNVILINVFTIPRMESRLMTLKSNRKTAKSKSTRKILNAPLYHKEERTSAISKDIRSDVSQVRESNCYQHKTKFSNLIQV